MRQATVCFLLRGEGDDRAVLLGYKKTGFGSGKYTGVGGKVEPGETIEQAAAREVQEEIGLVLPEQDLRPMGRVTFTCPARPDWDQEVFIFIATKWQGEPAESAEIAPGWFEPARLPFRRMWADAIYWIPPILNGVKIDGRITFADDCATVDRVAGL
jgi:8-oxo-dGTP diphosphatase